MFDSQPVTWGAGADTSHGETPPRPAAGPLTAEAKPAAGGAATETPALVGRAGGI